MSIRITIAVLLTAAVLTALAVPLLMGRGAIILVRKYTTFRNEEEKKKGQKICRITGAGLLVLDAVILAAYFLNDRLPSWFMYVILGIILAVIMVISYSQNKIIRELMDMQKEEQNGAKRK